MGWNPLAEKIRRFALKRNPEKKYAFKSYKEVAEIPPWPDLDLHISSPFKKQGVDFVVEENSCKGSLDCPISSRAELQRWRDGLI